MSSSLSISVPFLLMSPTISFFLSLFSIAIFRCHWHILSLQDFPSVPLVNMSRKSLHCKSLVLGYYPILPKMFRSRGFFMLKNRWKIILTIVSVSFFRALFLSVLQQTFLIIVFLITYGKAMFTKKLRSRMPWKLPATTLSNDLQSPWH